MQATEISIEKVNTEKLLGAASGDAALLYLYIKAGNDPAEAQKALRMTDSRFSCAGATLRQLGLWEIQKQQFIPGERPAYSEQDVLRAMDGDKDFRSLYGEVQRVLGRTLNTEELKILLGFVRYLGLSGEVVSVLICYCKERARAKGSLRNPSLRTIEKEAYAWAEQGIDSMEEAAAYISAQNFRRSQLGQLMQLLQIRGRNLTPGEEKYAQQWLDMGFSDDALSLAYDRTCLNTGNMNWAYMNKILTRWHNAGIRSAEDVKKKDQKTIYGASGKLGQAEMEAMQKLLQED